MCLFVFVSDYDKSRVIAKLRKEVIPSPLSVEKITRAFENSKQWCDQQLLLKALQLFNNNALHDYKLFPEVERYQDYPEANAELEKE